MFNNINASKIYGKRDDFEFDIVNFPLSDGAVLPATSYCVYISQFCWSTRQVSDINNRNKILNSKQLRQRHRYHKLRKTFSNRQHTERMSKYV